MNTDTAFEINSASLHVVSNISGQNTRDIAENNTFVNHGHWGLLKIFLSASISCVTRLARTATKKFLGVLGRHDPSNLRNLGVFRFVEYDFIEKLGGHDPC